MGTRIASRLIAVLVAVVAAGFGAPAVAQGPSGIGFAQAEEGTWYCRGDDPVSALNCARDLCQAESGGQECYRTAWCYPAGWAGAVTIWLDEFHSSQPMCGAPSREALENAMAAYCAEPYVASCDIWLVIDPDGMERPMSDEGLPSLTGSCDADAVAFALGAEASDALVEAVRLAAGAEEVRLIPPGTPITQDYRPSRLDFDLDAENRITRLWCG